MTGSPYWISGNGWETLGDVREWSRGSPGYPGVVGRLFRMYGNGPEAIQDVRE